MTIQTQQHTIGFEPQPAPGGKRRWYRISIEGARGGRALTAIREGRVSAIVPAWAVLAAIYNDYEFSLASIRVGEADDHVASTAEMTVCVPSGEAAEFVKSQQDSLNDWLRQEYGQAEPRLHCTITKCTPQPTVLPAETFEALMAALEETPQGVADDFGSINNVGRIATLPDHLLVVTTTFGPDADAVARLSQDIAATFTPQTGDEE